MPVNLMILREKASVLVATNEQREDIKFDAELDFCSVVHARAPADCPGYLLPASAGSRRGQEFLVGGR